MKFYSKYSILNLFRSEDGIQCVRFHKSTNDILGACEENSIYGSTMTSLTPSFLGQTSDSFVFNGVNNSSKKLISRHRGSYHLNQSATKNIQEEPSYLGFSTFDEIQLNNPQPEDLSKVFLLGSKYSLITSYFSDDVSDSGLGSMSSLRQPLQQLELSDLGIPSLNPSGFSLSELKKKSKK